MSVIDTILNTSGEEDFLRRADALAGAFMWDGTTEGQKFWQIQYQRLCKGRDLTQKARKALESRKQEASR